MTTMQSRQPDGATALGAMEREPCPRSRKAVVVGIDGSERNRAAVAWAVHEAETTGRPLNLIAVLNDFRVPIPHHSAPTDDTRDWKVLRQFAADVARARPELTVNCEMEADGTVGALLARSADQDLLVVGKRGLGFVARALIGSTSIAVAGRSRVPVVVVPDRWSQDQHTHEPVVVGLDPAGAEADVARFAFEEAHRRGAVLVVVHGWATERDGYGQRYDLQRITEVIEPLRAEYDGVRVELVRTHDDPASALLEPTRPAQLLVVGRHDQGPLGGFRLGSVTRSVLHHADLPVVVVPWGTLR